MLVRPRSDRRRRYYRSRAPANAAPREAGACYVFAAYAFFGGQTGLTLTAAAREFNVGARARTKLHGAFKVQLLRAQRGARVLLNISAKFWRNSRPARRVGGYRAGPTSRRTATTAANGRNRRQ